MAEELVPPKKIAAMVEEATSRPSAKNFCAFSYKLGGLKANSAVLDMGCGCGRIAGAVAQVSGRDGKLRRDWIS